MTVSVRMMRVMRWPLRSLVCKKFHVGLTIHGLERAPESGRGFCVEVKWRGPKRSLGPRFRSIKRERSRHALASSPDASLDWEQEFDCECTLALAKDSGFYPWDVALVIHKVSLNGSKAKLSAAGSGYLNLGELAPPSGNAKLRTKVPVMVDDTELFLSVTLDFEELRTVQEGVESNYRITAPAIPCISMWDREEDGEAGLKPFRSIIPGFSTKKSRVDDGPTDRTSDESSQGSPDVFESDSGDNFEDSDVVEDGEFPSSFRYGRIAGANLFPSHEKAPSGEDVLVFSGASGLAAPRLVDETSSSDSDQTSSQSSVKRMLSWRKRKLSFRSPRSRGEPLLNKAYGDTGGDEIDWDRRQSESPEQALDHTLGSRGESKAFGGDGAWDFGERFQVGSWESKELTSRDGHMKLSANVFFASIDQRSESAAGESACTALVAVLADWLHHHSAYMPSRAEFDSLIRDGSAEWRKLCQDSTFKDRFPDGHFDLETVIEAGVRPLSVNPGKSFIGFFQPEGLGDSNDFLQGAMSFDNIWDEVERCGPAIYIVSWNDHFFVLKVEEELVYIIDTLGERLFEGCDQAYLLKFDGVTELSEVVEEKKREQELESRDEGIKKHDDHQQEPGESRGDEAGVEEEKVEVQVQVQEKREKIYGRGACREFVKGFFAAVPLRQLQSDLKKGIVGKDHLHRRLQIEFHFTEVLG